MRRQYEDLDELLNEGKTEETRDVTSIVEGLIDQYGVNTAANILKSELNEDTDLNTELKVANEDGETDAQPADNQQNNNNQNDQQQQNNNNQNTQNNQQQNQQQNNQPQIQKEVVDEYKKSAEPLATLLDKFKGTPAEQNSIKLKEFLQNFGKGLDGLVNGNGQQGNDNQNQQQNNQNNQQNQQQNNQQNNQNNSGQ